MDYTRKMMSDRLADLREARREAAAQKAGEHKPRTIAEVVRDHGLLFLVEKRGRIPDEVFADAKTVGEMIRRISRAHRERRR